MRIDILSQRHPTYNAEIMARHDALYRGGHVFEQRIGDFLPRNPDEPEQVYQGRKARAHFTGYAGPIIDFFAAQLFATPPTVRSIASTGEPTAELPHFYSEYRENCDGCGTDLIDFARQAFVEAIVKGRAWWAVEMPDDGGSVPASRMEYDERGLGRATLRAWASEQVINWRADHYGELIWAVVYSCEDLQDTPLEPRCRVRETWRVYTRTDVQEFIAEYDSARENRPEHASATPPRPHGFARVPLVQMGFIGSRGVKAKVGGRVVCVSPTATEGFWLMNRLAGPQVAHFRNGAAMDWNIERTCYAMPVLELSGTDDDRVLFGPGYYIRLMPNEQLTWAAPPTGHLDVIASRLEAQRDEIYRVANQMARGVNNNAAAVGRSGDSKRLDERATEVSLAVYGAIVCEALQATYALVAEGRSEALRFSVEGFDTFSLEGAETLVGAAVQAAALGIPSATFRRELYCKTALALVPHVDQATRDKIREEICEGVTDEETSEPRRTAAVLDEHGEDEEDERPSERRPDTPPMMAMA